MDLRKNDKARKSLLDASASKKKGKPVVSRFSMLSPTIHQTIQPVRSQVKLGRDPKMDSSRRKRTDRVSTLKMKSPAVVKSNAIKYAGTSPN